MNDDQTEFEKTKDEAAKLTNWKNPDVDSYSFKVGVDWLRDNFHLIPEYQDLKTLSERNLNSKIETEKAAQTLRDTVLYCISERSFSDLVCEDINFKINYDLNKAIKLFDKTVGTKDE